MDEYKQSFDEQDYRNYLLEIKVMDSLLESATIVEKTDEWSGENNSWHR